MNVGQKAVRLMPHGFSFTKTGKFGILSDRTMIKGGGSMEVGFIRDKLAKRFQKEPEAVYAKVIQALCEE